MAACTILADGCEVMAGQVLDSISRQLSLGAVTVSSAGKLSLLKTVTARGHRPLRNCCVALREGICLYHFLRHTIHPISNTNGSRTDLTERTTLPFSVADGSVPLPQSLTPTGAAHTQA